MVSVFVSVVRPSAGSSRFASPSETEPVAIAWSYLKDDTNLWRPCTSALNFSSITVIAPWLTKAVTGSMNSGLLFIRLAISFRYLSLRDHSQNSVL